MKLLVLSISDGMSQQLRISPDYNILDAIGVG